MLLFVSCWSLCGLKENCSHRPIGLGTIKRHDLLEYVWPFWKKWSLLAGFQVSDAQTIPSVAFTSAACG